MARLLAEVSAQEEALKREVVSGQEAVLIQEALPAPNCSGDRRLPIPQEDLRAVEDSSATAKC